MLRRLLRQVLGRRAQPAEPGAGELERLILGAGEALRLERYAEAVGHYRRAIGIAPGNAEMHCNLATALKATGTPGEALAHYRVAVELKPELSEAWYNLGLLYAEACELEAAEACYREALARNPGSREAQSSLLCLASYHEGHEPERVLAEHREWGARHGTPPQPPPPHANERSPERRLRIGYVSADFREHAMAYFVEPVLAGHDAASFEAVLYSNASREDCTTRRLRGYAAQWHSIHALSDAAAAECIREDRVDLLVDLSGHTEGNRLGVFAFKPAPVQLSFLGYPNTTGLPAMDYRLTDARADPPGQSEHHYCERLLRMADSLWCYRPPADLPAVSELPARERGYVTFGSLNNVMKVSDSAIAVWAELLHAVAGARLLVAAGGGEVARRRLQSRFDAAGVERARVEFVGRLPPSEFRRLYAGVDLALDPFPCNGGTTTCETLWMGVPVVTLAGASFSSRAGLSILSTVGLDDLVASTRGRYVEIAAALASDMERLSRLRQGMRQRLAASPLMDEPGYVRSLEGLYRGAWRRWCAAA